MCLKSVSIFVFVVLLLSCSNGQEEHQSASSNQTNNSWNPPNDTFGWVARRTDTITDSLQYFEIIYGNLANIHARDLKLRDRIIQVIDSLTQTQGDLPLEVYAALYDTAFSVRFKIHTSMVEIDGLPNSSFFKPIRKSATDLLIEKLAWYEHDVELVIQDLHDGEFAQNSQEDFHAFDSSFVQISNMYLEYRKLRDSIAMELNLSPKQTSEMRSKYGKDK